MTSCRRTPSSSASAVSRCRPTRTRCRWSPQRLNRNATRPPSLPPWPIRASIVVFPSHEADGWLCVHCAAQSAMHHHHHRHRRRDIHSTAARMSRQKRLWVGEPGGPGGLGLLGPHGTAVTPLHSPEIVGQIFRDLSAYLLACLFSAAPTLKRSGSASPAVELAPPVQHQLSLATRDQPANHTRGWWYLSTVCELGKKEGGRDGLASLWPLWRDPSK
jgi:hypothetical protein